MITDSLHHRPLYVDQPAAGPQRLTRRELEVAALIARGYSTREVAHALGISPHTVRRHTERIFDKTGIRSRGRLIVWMATAPRHDRRAVGA